MRAPPVPRFCTGAGRLVHQKSSLAHRQKMTVRVRIDAVESTAIDPHRQDVILAQSRVICRRRSESPRSGIFEGASLFLASGTAQARTEVPRGKRPRTRMWHASARDAEQGPGVSAAAEIAPPTSDREPAVPALGVREDRICREPPGVLRGGLEIRRCAAYPAPRPSALRFDGDGCRSPAKRRDVGHSTLSPVGACGLRPNVHRQPPGCCRSASPLGAGAWPRRLPPFGGGVTVSPFV